MSEENAALARRGYDAFNRRDLDAFLDLVDADIQFTTRLIGSGTFRGHEGVRKWWREVLDPAPDFTIEVNDIRAVGDMTINHLRVRGRGALSHAPFDEATWMVGRWRDGKAVSWDSYSTEADALEAAGLNE